MWAIGAITILCCVAVSCCGGDARSSPETKEQPGNAAIASDTVVTRHYAETGGMWWREYELIARGTGEILLRTKIGMRDLGEPETWHIPPERISELISSLEREGFFALPATTSTPTQGTSVHSGTSVTSVVVGGKITQVTRQTCCGQQATTLDEQLRRLERRIESELGAEARIRQECFPGTEGPLP